MRPLDVLYSIATRTFHVIVLVSLRCKTSWSVSGCRYWERPLLDKSSTVEAPCNQTSKGNCIQVGGHVDFLSRGVGRGDIHGSVARGTYSWRHNVTNVLLLLPPRAHVFCSSGKILWRSSRFACQTVCSLSAVGLPMDPSTPR
jgi:hypothetical protein